MQRLYEVVAFRELGLSLESIAAVLDSGEVRLSEMLEAHLRDVQDRLTALRNLATTLTLLVSRVHHTEPLTASELLQLIDEVQKMANALSNLGNYLTRDQLSTVERREQQLGTEYFVNIFNQWPELIREVQAEIDAGTDPSDPRVQALAQRWMKLVEDLDGGDTAVREAGKRLSAEHPQEVQQHGGPSSEQIDFIHRANQAHGS